MSSSCNILIQGNDKKNYMWCLLCEFVLKTAEDTMCQLNIDNYKIKIGSIKLFNQFIQI